MTEIYTDQLRTAVSRIKKPHAFMLEIVQHHNPITNVDGLVLRVYESDIMRFTQPQREDIMQYLQQVKRTINAHGVLCAVQGVKQNG
jgi:hypothetical protein